MKRTLNPRLLLCALVLVVTTSAQAQEHQHADSTKTMPMEHGERMDHDGMMDREQMQAMMPRMMQMHERMMADSVLHRMMMADPERRQMMHEMMGDDHDVAAMRERLAAMSPSERRQRMEQMHARMMERMEAMPSAQREAMMQRMMAMHQKMMNDPAMHERMMADPAMRQMMEGMKEGGMMHEGMMHEKMDHEKMEGMQHEGMDHGAMGGMQPEQMAPMSADDARSAEAASRTADRFFTALAAGDRAAVEALLLPDAVVLEGGKTEARTEYLGHHFGSDTAFLAAVEREPLTRTTDIVGDAAWVATTSRLAGTVEGRARDINSAELLVLRRDASAPDGWRIAAVHWSSASRN